MSLMYAPWLEAVYMLPRHSLDKDKVMTRIRLCNLTKLTKIIDKWSKYPN